MVKVTDQDYYMDGYLQAALDTAKKVIKQDWDMVFTIDGTEGSGKSVMAQGMAYYCDPTLTNERIVFTPNAFRKAIINAKQYQSVVYDEGYTGLSSRASMSMINRGLVAMLAEIRQKNLFVFVVMPTFFDLDKYVAIWRSRALIHLYTAEGFQRGYFAFYNADRKKDLYINGKKYYSYAKPRPNFTGRFTNHYTVDEKEYKQNKRDSLMKREEQREAEQARREMEDIIFMRIMELGDAIPHSTKRRILNMPESTYFWKLKKYNDDKLAV